METKTITLVIIGVLTGGVFGYILAPEKEIIIYVPSSQNGISESEYNELSNEYDKLKRDYDSLESAYSSLQITNELIVQQNINIDLRVKELEFELRKYVPLETGEVGKSRINPARAPAL